MKKIITWVLLLSLCFGLLAGCGNSEPETTDKVAETTQATEPQVEDSKASAANALAYVKNMYKSAGEKTPKDFNRVGIVTIGGKQFEVVWTVNVGEETVKIVKNDNGMVTIDVNEQSEEDVPYVLTATVTGNDGEYSYEWNHLVPVAMKVEDIIRDAFALKDGEVLPYEASLTGEVVSVDTPYDDGYKNITVSIAPTGFEDKVIKCYRLKGEGVEKIVAGNIITVTGTIKNYKGTIEFDQGCIMDAWEEGNPIIMPTDPLELVDMAYELPRGQSLPAAVTLTGIITSIDTPYDAGYGNITVTIAIPGRLNKPIMCYRMKGEGLDKLKTSDEITVTGTIINYNGTREFNSGCQLIKCVPGGGHVQPKDQVQVVKEAYALPLAGNLLYTAELTGNITKINSKYSASYGNITVTFVVEGAEDMPIQCYRMTGDGSKLSKLKVGDTITVRGLIKNYYRFSDDSSTIQYDKPVLVDAVFNSGSTTPTNSAMKPCSNIKPGVAYKFGFRQNGISGKPFQMITGEMDGYYGDTVTNAAQAIDTYVEEANGGYYIYTQKGTTKKYINVVVSGTYYNVKYEATPSSVWQLNEEFDYVYTTCTDGTEVYLGTYGQNTTLGASKTSYISDTSKIGVSQFCAWFLEIDPDGDMGDDSGDSGNTGNTSGATVVTAPQAETAYKLGMDKGDGTILYFNGQTESASVTYRLATTTNADEAVDVYLESATGGYRLYFMNGTTKTYIRVFHRTDGDPGYGKGSLEYVTTAPSEVYTYNTTANTLFYDYDGNNAYYMGTYSTYTTVSVSNTSYITGSKADTVDVSQFPVRFYTTDGSTGGNGGNTSGGGNSGSTTTPAEGFVADPQTETAYKIGLQQNGADGKVYYFTGSESGNYLGTTTDATQAADVKLEAATGGYKLYTEVGGTKYYITIEKSVSSSNGKTYYNPKVKTAAEATPSVWVLNKEYKYITTTHSDGTEVVMGTYSTYTTISCSKSSFISDPSVIGVSQFCVWFLESTGTGSGTTPTPTPDPEPVSGTKYTFANYAAGVNNYGTSEEHKLDDNVTVTVYGNAYFTSQLRLYDYTSSSYPNSSAVLKFSKPVTKLTLNAGYKDATLEILVSNDGATWTALSDVAVSASYADKTVDLGGAYTYVKLQASPQVRIIYMIVQFKEN